METTTDHRAEPTAVRTDLGALFVSLRLSRSSWVVTALSPGGGEKRSCHPVPGGDLAGLLARFSLLRDKAQARTGCSFPIIVIRKAGLDGFWIHRTLENEDIESHVVDPASIATSQVAQNDGRQRKTAIVALRPDAAGGAVEMRDVGRGDRGRHNEAAGCLRMASHIDESNTVPGLIRPDRPRRASRTSAKRTPPWQPAGAAL